MSKSILNEDSAKTALIYNLRHVLGQSYQCPKYVIRHVLGHILGYFFAKRTIMMIQGTT
jgi:hypothetical protein